MIVKKYYVHTTSSWIPSQAGNDKERISGFPVKLGMTKK
jgi:hypothetical protein